MHYNGPVVRPPHEANSVLLEVSVGCTHNQCRFCNFYRSVGFSMAPIEQIEEDLQEVSLYNPMVPRIFAVGGDPFSFHFDKLKTLAILIRKYLPIANIAMYARITNIYNKSIEQLKELRSLGINDLVIGIESGYDKALKYMNKGYKSNDILVQCKKLEEAGIHYYLIYLGGLAGKGLGEKNAIESAKVMNQLHPSHLYVTSLAVLPDTELYHDVQAGLFEEASELERLKETKVLIENLENPITIYGESIANPVHFNAVLPRDKKRLIQEFNEIISHFTKQEENILRSRRTRLRNV